MDIFDQILENLELERELGTRAVEIDRALIVPPVPEAPTSQPRLQEPIQPQKPAPIAKSAKTPMAAASKSCDIMFLSGRPLSAAGIEAVRKMMAAMKKIRPNADVRFNEDGSAKVLILLGADALKGRNAVASGLVRGRWLSVDGVPAMPTFSPDYIFSHFVEGTSGMLAAKRNMWDDVKAAMARLPSP